jgi:4-carboxymuconolactone decarboxylase
MPARYTLVESRDVNFQLHVARSRRRLAWAFSGAALRKDRMQITLPTNAELAGDTLAALGTAPPLNVFRMIARAPSSLAPFIALARSILVGSSLSPQLRELAVLRVTHVAGSDYAFQQHVQLAKMVGLDAAAIAATTADGPVTALDATGNLACQVADEITRDVRLSDETLAKTVEAFGQRQATELVLCCSYFNMVARFLESTRTPLDLLGGAS